MTSVVPVTVSSWVTSRDDGALEPAQRVAVTGGSRRGAAAAHSAAVSRPPSWCDVLLRRRRRRPRPPPTTPGPANRSRRPPPGVASSIRRDAHSSRVRGFDVVARRSVRAIPRRPSWSPAGSAPAGGLARAAATRSSGCAWSGAARGSASWPPCPASSRSIASAPGIRGCGPARPSRPGTGRCRPPTAAGGRRPWRCGRPGSNRISSS